MDSKALWACSLIAVIAIACALWFIPGRGVRTRGVRTLQIMQNVAMDLDLLQNQDSNALVRLTDGEANDSLELNKAVAAVFKASADPYITNSVKSASPGVFRDAWGGRCGLQLKVVRSLDPYTRI